MMRTDISDRGSGLGVGADPCTKLHSGSPDGVMAEMKNQRSREDSSAHPENATAAKERKSLSKKKPNQGQLTLPFPPLQPSSFEELDDAEVCGWPGQ